MGTLTCSRCKATTEANSIDDGRKLLDHSIGLYKGKPCEDGKAELFFTGKQKSSSTKETSTDTESQSKVKKIGNTIKKSKDLFKSKK